MKLEFKTRLVRVFGAVLLLLTIGLIMYARLSSTPEELEWEQYCAEYQPSLTLSDCMKLGSQ